jgi:hypothetical protein
MKSVASCRICFSHIAVLFVASTCTHAAFAEIVLPNLPAGTIYQLVFVTRNGSDAYTKASPAAGNNMVQTAANANPDLPTTAWKVVASFGANASINAPVYDGVPIYNLSGQLVAVGANFYSGSHLAPISFDEFGAYAYRRPWTGMAADGRPYNPVSAVAPAVTYGFADATNGEWASGGTSYNSMETRSWYGLSGQLVAVPEPSASGLAASALACGGWLMRRRRRRAWCYGQLAAMAIIAVTAASFGPTYAITIEMVTVGDSGNTADTTGYGAVAYEYQIGKYEVTIGQYASFLNAVAADDPNAVYDPRMGWPSVIWSSRNIAGITQSGSPSTYKYAVSGPFGAIRPLGADSPSDRPITLTSWSSAARFANWMANGQPTGAQGPTTTENGAYDLTELCTGVVPAKHAINPNTQAPPTFYVPTENEWYKAAYYKGGGTNAGYWDYATQSDSAPGNIIGALANQAN